MVDESLLSKVLEELEHDKHILKHKGGALILWISCTSYSGLLAKLYINTRNWANEVLSYLFSNFELLDISFSLASPTVEVEEWEINQCHTALTWNSLLTSSHTKVNFFLW
jgi:hypothetical protein